ncbi:putative reverse transcriptase domain-containing protein [Tanacetum coccineum]
MLEICPTPISVGHYRSDCPNLKNQNCGKQPANSEARERAYALGGGEANQDSNVVTGTFLLNNRYAFILFDFGADRSFVSTTFSSLIDIIPTALDVSYAVELADGGAARSDIIIRGCTLNLLNHPFNIDLKPVELDIFDVIIGMDGLSKYVTTRASDPQEEEDNIEVDIEEDENEPELTYPYEVVDPLNPSPPASESEPEYAIEVEIPIEHEDETVPASVHEVGESSTAPFLREDSDVHALVEKKGKAKDEYYGKLILDLGNEVRSSMEQGTTTMEKLVEKLGNAEDKVECKKLKKEIEKARFSNTFLQRGFVFEERPNEAINVLIEDEKSPSFEPRGSPHLTYWLFKLMLEVNVALQSHSIGSMWCGVIDPCHVPSCTSLGGSWLIWHDLMPRDVF